MSKKNSLVVIFFVVIFSSVKARDPRIVGGRLAKQGEFPYQVSLRRSYSNEHFCGGTIITVKHILTAAHCMYYTWGGPLLPALVSVTAGELTLNVTSNTVRRNASRIIIHPQYNHNTLENDIAIVELEEELPVDNKNIKTISLNDQTYDNLICVVSGWGIEEYDSFNLSKSLLCTDVSIVDFAECQRRYQVIYMKLNKGILCAANEGRVADACQGDSGGPLACDERLTGVISSGIGCADSQYPGIYSDVKYYRSWIQNVSKIEFESTTLTEKIFVNQSTTEIIEMNLNNSFIPIIYVTNSADVIPYVDFICKILILLKIFL